MATDWVSPDDLEAVEAGLCDECGMPVYGSYLLCAACESVLDEREGQDDELIRGQDRAERC